MLGKTKITTRCHLTLCGCNTSPLIRAPFFLLLYEVLLERHASERGGWRWATALDAQRHGKSTALCGAFVGGPPMHESRRSFIKHSLRAKSTMDGKSSFTYQSQMFFNLPWYLGRNLKFIFLFHWTDISKFLRSNDEWTIFWWQTFTSTSFSKIGSWDVQKKMSLVASRLQETSSTWVK